MMLMVTTTLLVAEMAEAGVTLLQVELVEFLGAAEAAVLHRQQRQLAVQADAAKSGFGRIR
mgnify:CR=1 FL=1